MKFVVKMNECPIGVTVNVPLAVTSLRIYFLIGHRKSKLYTTRPRKGRNWRKGKQGKGAAIPLQPYKALRDPGG
jgi:hypothetical protein